MGMIMAQDERIFFDLTHADHYLSKDSGDRVSVQRPDHILTIR